MTSAFIRRLTLTKFRSYRALQIDTDGQLVVLTGPNGAGKTNLIEAISLLTPGRGLRRASFDELAHSDADGSWAIAAQVEGALGLATLGTGIDARALRSGDQRRCRIDGETVGSAGAFMAHLHLAWLVPSMDGLFTGPAAERRRFIDRMALSIDPDHVSRVNALERSLRARNRLLETPAPDPRWLDAVEHETAEIAVAVAAGRAQTVDRLAATLAARRDDALFPSARVALGGWREAELAEAPASEVEDRYRAALHASRPRDAAAGRTLEGPHLSDLLVTFPVKEIPAASASTGEQKALLIGLVLAQSVLIAEATGQAPVLLLDEVVAHLDPQRRLALYAWLEQSRAQVFMTGADPAAFADIRARATVFEIMPGTARRAS